MEEYRKSYRGLFSLTILLMAGMISVIWLPADGHVKTLVSLNVMTMWCALLTWIIYRTERIYWYTGLMFEEAAAASSEARRAYGWKIFRKFFWSAAAYLAYSLVSWWLNLPEWLDIVLACVAVTAAALSTMAVRLTEE
ncbi:MAG: hypothetical protein IJM26_05040 [Lachnospiraceae bacterium]|nr:hypothetical protein [Lachnospiraceae bacterium]